MMEGGNKLPGYVKYMGPLNPPLEETAKPNASVCPLPLQVRGRLGIFLPLIWQGVVGFADELVEGY